MTGRTCSDCGTPISAQSKSGRCHRDAMAALHADPAYREKRLAGLDRHFAKPGAKEAATSRLRKYQAQMPDADRERRREHGRWLAREVLTPERVAKSHTPEARARSIKGNEEAKLGWCPLDRRDEYRLLVRRKRYSAAEARALIEADLKQIADQQRKRPRTFEDQLAAVAAGAVLVGRVPTSRPAPESTLGGVASGML